MYEKKEEEISQLACEFENFFLEYPCIEEPKYKQIIRNLALENQKSLFVNFEDLMEFLDISIIEILIRDPNLFLEAITRAFAKIYGPTFEKLHVRIKGTEKYNLYNVKNVGSNIVGKYVAIKGIITNMSKKYGFAEEICFECLHCGELNYIPQKDTKNKIKAIKCSNTACGQTSFREDLEKSKMVDFQTITLQEIPENLIGGVIPPNVHCEMYDDMVGSILPGSVVTLEGVFAARPKSKTEALYEYYLKVVSCEKNKKFKEITFTKEEIEKFNEMAKDPALITNLVSAIAPQIYGHENIKLALLLAAVGASQIILPDGVEKRPFSHILIVGDPSTAKSRLLEYIAKLVGGIFTTGTGVTGVGLTAAVVPDPHGKGWTLDAGALVLADGALCCVDEFEKMTKGDRTTIVDTLSSGVVKINKAGINARLPARTSIIAAANPEEGVFDPYKTIISQIKIFDPVLLSRFDLIFIVMDKPNPEKDKKIVDTIFDLQMYPDRLFGGKYQFELLGKYVQYAKTIKTKMTEEAREKLSNYWLSIRGLFEEQNRNNSRERKPIPISTRSVEGLIRLTEALAKLQLKEVVTEDLAEIIIKLFDETYREVMEDPNTHLLDTCRLTERTINQQEKIAIIRAMITFLSEKYEEKGINFAYEDELKIYLEKEGLTLEEIEEYINYLIHEGDVYKPSLNKINVLERFEDYNYKRFKKKYENG